MVWRSFRKQERCGVLNCTAHIIILFVMMRSCHGEDIVFVCWLWIHVRETMANRTIVLLDDLMHDIVCRGHIEWPRRETTKKSLGFVEFFLYFKWNQKFQFLKYCDLNFLSSRFHNYSLPKLRLSGQNTNVLKSTHNIIFCFHGVNQLDNIRIWPYL